MINNLVFPAPQPSYNSSLAQETGHELVHMPWRTTADSTLAPLSPMCIGLLIRVPASTHLVLYAHPNAADIGHMAEEMEYFGRKSKCSVLLWEFHGYGLLNDSSAGEEVIKEDMLAAFHFAVCELRVPASQIVLMGRSIGTGPSTWMAANCTTFDWKEFGSCCQVRQCAAPCLLFLQAPFTSIVDCCKTVARKRLPTGLEAVESLPSMIVADRFRNIDLIHRVPCPVVIQHGDLDEIVTYDHAERLVSTAKINGKSDVTLVTAKGFGHNNLSCTEAAIILSRALLSRQTPLDFRVKPFHVLHPPLFMHRSQMSLNDFRAACQGLVDIRTRQGIIPLLLCSVVECVSRLAPLKRSWTAIEEGLARRVDTQSGSFGNMNRIFSGLRQIAGRVQQRCETRNIDLLEHYFAVWGSPLGVYQLESTSSGQLYVSVFGLVCECKGRWTDVSPQGKLSTVMTPGGVCFRVIATLLEMRTPPFLLHEMLVLVDSFLNHQQHTDEVALSQAQLERLQMQIERTIISINDNQWSLLQSLLRRLESVQDPARPTKTMLTLAQIKNRLDDLEQPGVLPQPTESDYDMLLCSTKNIASVSGTKCCDLDGTSQLSVDDAWILARVLHKRACMLRLGADAITPNPKRSLTADNDCSLM